MALIVVSAGPPGPREPREVVLLGNEEDCFSVAHVVIAPLAGVDETATIGVAAELAELCDRDRLVCAVEYLLDLRLEAVGALSLIALLVRSHVRVVVVHD